MQNNKMVETSCYVVGAGAFGVFCRWMQLQIAFDDNMLVDPSFWNYAVLLYTIAAAVVFYRFTEQTRKKKQFVPSDFFEAFENEGKLYTIASCAIGALMCIGAVILFFNCETDKNRALVRILCLLAILSGVSFPFVMVSANKPTITRKSTMALLQTLPVIMYCFWLVLCYKENSNNSVIWEFAVEVVTIIFCILTFFRLAGFAYGAPDAQKAQFGCMFTAVLCITCIADSRYLGMQVIFISTALMFLYCNWVMVSNLRQRTAVVEEEAPDDGFVHL